jgi:hypothetical protein
MLRAPVQSLQQETEASEVRDLMGPEQDAVTYLSKLAASVSLLPAGTEQPMLLEAAR